MPERLLYDLAGEDPGRRFSPYCWRIKFALKHKNLVFDTVIWRFAERNAIAFSGQGKVPVLVDGDQIVHDSWHIAEYLESSYPDAPSLFGGTSSRSLTQFVSAWADTILIPAVAPLVMVDIPPILHEDDRQYFRESREARFGASLEALSQDRDERVVAFRQSLLPLRRMLAHHDFLGGQSSNFADYSVFSVFQWARCVSDFALLADDDVVAQWGARMLALFDGMAGAAPGSALTRAQAMGAG